MNAITEPRGHALATTTSTRTDSSIRRGGHRAAAAVIAAVAMVAGTGMAAVADTDLPTVARIATGAGHSLAVDASGTIWAWGSNSDGQLGDGTKTDSPAPHPLANRGAIPAGVAVVQLVSAGNRSLALGDDGKVYGWGDNASGRLGDGTTVDRPFPVVAAQGAIPPGVKLVDLAATTSSTYALGDDGDTYAWGANGSGFLGDGTKTAQTAPVRVQEGQIPPGVKLVDIAASLRSSHVVAIGDDGRAYAWGQGGSGQLGNGATASSTTPVAVADGVVPAGTDLVRAATGDGFSSALGDDGAVYAWGLGASGQLGNGATPPRELAPVKTSRGAIPAGVKLVELAALSNASLALGDDGAMYTWGAGSLGQLGNGAVTQSAAPVAVTRDELGSARITSISAGDYAAAAVADDGRAYAWGQNASGQLGDGGTQNRTVPVEVQIGADGSQTRQTTVVVSPLAVAYAGESSSLTAVVSPAEATGQVEFVIPELNRSLGTASVIDGTAELAVTLERGAYQIVARFASARPLVFSSSVSAAVPLTVADSRTPAITASQPRLSGAYGVSSNPKLTLTLVDGDTPSSQLAVTAQPRTTTMFPAGAITITGEGDTRTVALDPRSRLVAEDTVTFTVTDPQGNSSSVPVSYITSHEVSSPSAYYYNGNSDASATVDVGGGYLIVSDDENQRLGLYKAGESGYPERIFDFGEATGDEIDIEGAARYGDTIYWIGSYGNSSSSGAVRPSRRSIFTTTVTGSGADTVLTLGTHGRSSAMRTDLIEWDAANGHGLGANRLKMANGIAGGFPVPPDGFNIEGFEFAPGTSKTAYLGFRAPSITVNGAQHALVVPVENLDAVVGGTATAQFGDPILMDLGGRTIRDIRKNAHDQYVILAGPVGGQGYALYTWNGEPGDAPVLNRLLPTLSTAVGNSWEAVGVLPDRLVTGATVEIISDSGDALLYENRKLGKDQPQDLRKAYADTFALGAVAVEPELELEPSVSTRVLAGKAYLTVSVRNADDVAADLRVDTPFGSKSFTGVAPGSTVSVSVNSRAAVLPAGVAAVTATGSDGSTFERELPFGG